MMAPSVPGWPLGVVRGDESEERGGPSSGTTPGTFLFGMGNTEARVSAVGRKYNNMYITALIFKQEFLLAYSIRMQAPLIYLMQLRKNIQAIDSCTPAKELRRHQNVITLGDSFSQSDYIIYMYSIVLSIHGSACTCTCAKRAFFGGKGQSHITVVEQCPISLQAISGD